MTPFPNHPHIHVLLTDRHGGCSQHPYHSLNLGTHVNDHLPDVIENRRMLAEKHHLAASDFVYMNQVHGTQVRVITSNASPVNDCDAMITTVPGLVLMVLVADCVPMVFADVKKNVVAVAHAGWRGTVGGIGAKVIAAMHENWACRPGDIHVIIGPSIGSCCYNVGEEVLKAIDDTHPEMRSAVIQNENQYFFDLQLANVTHLIGQGVLPEHINRHTQCVSCHSQQWFSYRASGGTTGRFGMGIWIDATCS